MYWLGHLFVHSLTDPMVWHQLGCEEDTCLFRSCYRHAYISFTRTGYATKLC